MSDVEINKYLLVYLNYNYDFVANIFHFLPSLFTLSNRVTFHNRHETNNCCFLWYVQVCDKDSFLIFSTKLVTFANNSHLHWTIIDNF